MTEIRKGDRVRIIIEGPWSGDPYLEGEQFDGHEVEYVNDVNDRVFLELIDQPARAFKVGDRAVIATNKWDDKHGVSPFRKGALVEVVKPAITDSFDWYVKPLDGTTSFLPIKESELQYAPEKKFKVGQLVKFDLQPSFTYQVVVTPERSVLAEAKYDYRIQNVETGNSCWAFERELTALPQSFSLRRGDRIVNTKTGRQGHVVEGIDGVLWVVDESYDEETGAPAKAVEEYEHHYPNTYELTNRKETEGPF